MKELFLILIHKGSFFLFRNHFEQWVGQYKDKRMFKLTLIRTKNYFQIKKTLLVDCELTYNINQIKFSQSMKSLQIPSIDEKFNEILNKSSWLSLENIYQRCTRISIFGNGGNLAVADHAAIDTSRLTNKLGLCPGSGILASSLINDIGHDNWLKKWVEITSRGLTQDILKDSLFIGISSSGKSENVVSALNYAHSIGSNSFLITASSIKTDQEINFGYCDLNLDEYHSAEVMTLLLTYQLIHSSGFVCPPISKSTFSEKFSFKK